MNPTLSPKVLFDLVRYEPGTGKFFWKERPASSFKNIGDAFVWNADNSGKEIFKSKDWQGYRLQIIKGETVRAHRAAWAIQHGKWPEKHLDHINGVKYDNRIQNLREVDAKLNARNSAMPCTNTSGHVGVAPTESGKFEASVCQKHLGTFDTLPEAIAAREEAQKRIGGFTDRHGKPSIKEIRVRGYSLRRKLRKEAAIRNAAQQATG